MSALLGFFRCSPQRRILLLDAMFRLLIVRCTLNILSLACVDKLTRSGPRALSRSNTADIISAIETASLYAPAPSCLVRALAASWLLRLNGFNPVLRYGVTRVSDGLDAHAWIEIDGRVVLGGGFIDQYALLAPIPQP